MANKLKQILQNGKPAVGTWLGCSDPYFVEMIADLGFDWLIVDMEHIPLSHESLRTMIMACKGSESTIVVRVSLNSRNLIQAALDLGAQGVMVPMVNTRADAEQAVGFTRYPPLGRRGLGPVRAGQYGKTDAMYRETANDEILLFVQIETPEAVQNAPQILQVRGINGLFIGNADLANFMNNGQFGSATVQKVVDDLIALSTRASTPIGLPTWSPAEFDRYAQLGAQLLTLGADMRFAAMGARTELQATRDLVAKAKVPSF
ncbi:MAG TPA: aldolase/citrate lyase family protein [Candidatus Sulfotelmatobacter sp.]|nr:aldolase/citrate lyase family protein [Candidatus Sulfotelmatobacter sp.]